MAKRGRSVLASGGDRLTPEELAEMKRSKDPAYRRRLFLRAATIEDLTIELGRRGFKVLLSSGQRGRKPSIEQWHRDMFLDVFRRMTSRAKPMNNPKTSKAYTVDDAITWIANAHGLKVSKVRRAVYPD